MHRLTCNDADRLAADLDRAAVLLHHLAALEQRYGDGLTVTGDFTRAQLHCRTSESARSEAQQLQDFARRLRDRTDLWESESRAPQERARPTAAFPASVQRGTGRRRRVA